MKFILGKKRRMTQYFAESGMSCAATLIQAGPAVVTQIKTPETDGYTSVQIGFGEGKVKHINKAQKGHTKDLGDFSVMREFRTAEGELKRGDTLTVDQFLVGELVTVTGTSKGKGFQGVVKRHKFRGGPRTHGQKHTERSPGSIGSQGPQRVYKGTRMAGRMGGDQVSVKNLEVLAVDPATNTLLVKGAIPGVPGSLVEIVTSSS